MNSRKKYSISPHIQPRDLEDFELESISNIYEAISIMGKRSVQISLDLKEELHGKLNEFASTTDTLDEVHENKEQIEISKAYEKMPHPTLMALEEFLDEKTYHRYRKPENKKKIFIRKGGNND